VSYDYSETFIYPEYIRNARATGATPQMEIVVPIWQTGDTMDREIWADQPVGGTGVILDEGEESEQILTWMDTNRDARRWVQIGVSAP
jgi:hypothetical protein